MRSTEKRCLQQWRNELLIHAHGDLLEIGAGTGVNLPHYPNNVLSLTLSEPDQQMRKYLHRKVTTITANKCSIATWSSDSIDMPDASFDTIVSTLVLCSVPCLDSSLSEIKRVLRPNGVLLFLEHIASDHHPTLKLQQRIEPLWSFCAGNCRLTRETTAAITNSGFEIDQITEAPMIGAPAFVNRTIRGIARKTPPGVA